MEIQSKKIIASHFEKMGARAEIIEFNSLSRREARMLGVTNERFNINISNDKHGEYFVISAGEDVSVTIPNIEKENRHLLLNVSRRDSRNRVSNEKYLCGHDERHWFVAAIPGNGVTNVRTAMNKLKPELAELAQINSGVRKKDLHKRKNKGYKRQGEWFFIPAPEFQPDIHFMFSNEPIVRGRGKPHMCETLCRRGGTPVMQSSEFPNGLTIPEYEEFMRKNPNDKHNWRHMTREAQVFVTGKITHSDHKTVELIGWHLVVPNTESKAIQFTGMAFLD